VLWHLNVNASLTGRLGGLLLFLSAACVPTAAIDAGARTHDVGTDPHLFIAAIFALQEGLQLKFAIDPRPFAARLEFEEIIRSEGFETHLDRTGEASVVTVRSDALRHLGVSIADASQGFECVFAEPLVPAPGPHMPPKPEDGLRRHCPPRGETFVTAVLSLPLVLSGGHPCPGDADAGCVRIRILLMRPHELLFYEVYVARAADRWVPGDLIAIDALMQ
jgi:hypothetical protein